MTWRDACLPQRERQGHEAKREREHAQGDEPVIARQHHAQRRTRRDAAVRGDTVPRDHPCGVLTADAADAPGNRSRAHPAFGKTQAEAAQQDQHKGERRDRRHQRRERQEQSGQCQHYETRHDSALRPHGVGHASRVRAAEQRRKILRAHRQPRHDRRVTEIEMREPRQHRQRNADAQVTDKRKDDRRKNSRGHRKPATAMGDEGGKRHGDGL